MLYMHDGVRLRSVFQNLQRVIDYHGLHPLVSGQTQRMAEGKLHGHRPGNTVPLCPIRHHRHQNCTETALFKHARQNQHVLTAAGSSRGEEQRLDTLYFHLLQHFGSIPIPPLRVVGDWVALIAHDGVGTGRQRADFTGLFQLEKPVNR